MQTYKGFDIQRLGWSWVASPTGGRAGVGYSAPSLMDLYLKIDRGTAVFGGSGGGAGGSGGGLSENQTQAWATEQLRLYAAGGATLDRYAASINEDFRRKLGEPDVDFRARVLAEAKAHPYTLRDHEAAVWRNRPNADEDLYDAPVVERYSPRKRTALWLLAVPLAWLALGVLGVFLTNFVAWVFDAPMAVAVFCAALIMCAGFLLLMWVRR